MGRNRIGVTIHYRYCKRGDFRPIHPVIAGARTFILSDEFVVVGSQRVTLNDLQTPRWYMKHWLVESLFRASCVRPVDLLMTYGGGDYMSINCPNFQIWRGLWGILSSHQLLATDVGNWPTLFRNNLSRTVALHRRFQGHG